MNRVSRRSAPEEVEALLEAGRTEPVLHYDVELGLERHHRWLRSDAPIPEWASASLGTATATKSLASVVIKTIVSALLMGTFAITAWYAHARPQPSAAEVQVAFAAAERTRAITPSTPDVAAPENWLAHTPLPVSDHALPKDEPARRAVRDKRATRLSRPHARAASTHVEPAGARPEPARSEPAAAETTQPASVHEVVSAPAPEHKPINTARAARPEPGPQAQAPNDLVEMQQVAAAEQLLERSPERALALVRQGDQSFSRGYFQQERAYIAIMALIRIGRVEEARARAASFARQFPALPYGARIRSALAAAPAAAAN